MAAYNLYSHSPQVSDMASPQHQVPGPITPIHSPHHSVHSSTSLRTPLHTLSIHEYRKQQGTPLSRIATPPGKVLRRKAAASALNEIERVPSTKLAQRRDSHSSSQPLHSFRSAHQLAPHNQIFGVQPVSDQVLRSQSAEPQTQGGSISSVLTAGSNGKLRQFGSRKRLPRPPPPTGFGSNPQPHVPVRPTQQIRATLPASLSFLTEDSNLGDTQNTPTPSTLSISRFPQPPHFETLRESEREKAVSFSTTAPATPPATPATIHYRGASFDLVNPHASLQYRDIVTPSRDFDSSDFLPLRSTRDSQSSDLEMAPKRPLYGDFNAAHAGIVRRAEDYLGSSALDLPLPPTPAAISPGSSTYTSPIYSSESRFAPPPLAIKKGPTESRFSIKQLTRNLTKRLTKPIETGEEEELQEFQENGAGRLSIRVDEGSVRSPAQTYIPADRTLYFPISPVSPTSPTSPASIGDLGSISGEDDELEYAREIRGHEHDSQGLASLLPDDPSTQVGRAEQRSPTFASGQAGRPYYDDLASLYASSSIYTVDDRQKSSYQPSLAGKRQSIMFPRSSDVNFTESASTYSYDGSDRKIRPLSRPLTQGLRHVSVQPSDGNTDTISEFIDQYDPGNTSTNNLDVQTNMAGSVVPRANDVCQDTPKDRTQAAPYVPGLSQFEFGLDPQGESQLSNDMTHHAQPTFNKGRALNRQPGLPPLTPAPLAPAFQHDQTVYSQARPESSDILSNGSYTSYGDTRNLLQIPQSEASRNSMILHGLQPSSSYSQPRTKALDPSSSYSQPEDRTSPQTPQEALDHAELIFDQAAAQREPSSDDIPAMWGRRSSVNLLRSKRLTVESRNADIDKADWETVAGDSQRGRMSLDSIANYSSSEGSRNSLDLAAQLTPPSWTKQDRAYAPIKYDHPSPLGAHAYPFSSSPPHLATCPDSKSARHISTPDAPPSSRATSSVPVIRFSTQHRQAVDEPYALAPWADLYALSDKETQELLASGPNDDVLIDGENSPHPRRISYNFRSHGMHPETSSPCSAEIGSELKRENTFDKFTVIGPKGNLTGTPQGTGMRDAGSSVADTSSPGAQLSSSTGPSSSPANYHGFYTSSFPATGSVTRIRQSQSADDNQHERTPSQATLFPSAYSMEPIQGTSPLASSDHRQSLRYSTTFKPARRTSRAAVPGQTKLRQMVLAPDARRTLSSQETHFPIFVSISGSGRPSTSDTATPLHPTHPSLDTFQTIRSGKTSLAHLHSPHLLCPEREVKEEDEVRRRKLSWMIFACFCILPPCMFLFRMWGDSIIMSVTKGELGHCTIKSKRAALIAGVVVNIGLITAILVPILVAQALKAI